MMYSADEYYSDDMEVQEPEMAPERELDDEYQNEYDDMFADDMENPIACGMYDDDPSPYDGTYSEE